MLLAEMVREAGSDKQVIFHGQGIRMEWHDQKKEKGWMVCPCGNETSFDTSLRIRRKGSSEGREPHI
jgi:hypothetical protein